MADQNMSNFLATDKVPDTIFGIPIVSRREDYTKADVAFFDEHPEAGGYYDMGEGTPEDGTEEGAPVQEDVPVKKSSYINPDAKGMTVEIPYDERNAEQFDDPSYNRDGAFFRASDPTIPELTDYYINVGNKSGNNRVAIPTLKPDVGLVRRVARFIWDHHYRKENGWGNMTEEGLARDLWRHSKAKEYADNVAKQDAQSEKLPLLARVVQPPTHVLADRIHRKIASEARSHAKNTDYNDRSDWKSTAAGIMFQDWDAAQREYDKKGVH